MNRERLGIPYRSSAAAADPPFSCILYVPVRVHLLSGVCHRLPASFAVAVVSDQVAWDRRSDSRMASCLE